jgi:hypothetical protein
MKNHGGGVEGERCCQIHPRKPVNSAEGETSFGEMTGYGTDENLDILLQYPD